MVKKEATPEDIENQIELLRKDVKLLSDTVYSVGKQKVESITRDAKSAISETKAEVEDEFTMLVRKSQTYVNEKPIQSFLMVGLAGFLLGRFLK